MYYRGEGDENNFHNTEVSRLRASEDFAAGNFSEQQNLDYNSEMNSRREAENRPILLNDQPVNRNGEPIRESFWRGQGREDNNIGKKRRGFFSGKIGKFGPAFLIIAALFGGGGIAFLSSSMGPFALVSNALDQFNVMRTAMNRRSTYFMRFQMDETLNTSLTNKRFGIFSSEKFKISNKMQKKLAKQNIDYKEDASGARYLVYTNQDTGEVTPIVANEKDLSKLNGVEITNADGKPATKGVMLLDAALEADGDFFTAHQSATKTIKGHIVGWFESLTESFHSRIGNKRNKFSGTTDETSDEDIINKAKSEGMSEDMDDSKGRTGEIEEDTEIVRDADGNIEYEEDGVTPKTRTTETQKPYTDSDSASSGAQATQVESALKTKAQKAAAAFASKVNVLQMGQGLACGAISILNVLNLAITAVQVAKTLNFVTGMLEAVQRTQIGDGGSEMMTYFNAFSVPKESEVWSSDPTNTTVTESDITSGAWNNSTTSIQTTVVGEKSTMATPAYNKVFGGPDVDPSDPQVEKFNRDYAAKYSLGASGNGALATFGSFLSSAFSGQSATVAYEACLYSGMALSVVSAVAGVAVAILSGGISVLFEGFAKAAAIAALVTVVSVVISAIVPKVAQFLAKDLIGDLGGEDSANAMLSGFNIYMGKSMESNSGAVGGEEAVLAMYGATQEVLAEDARYDRLTRSPLDPTSKYTFVGSIVHSLIPIGNMLSGNSFVSAVGQAMSTVGSSALSLLPMANAAGRETWYDLGLNHDCPNLKGLNLVGDAYCNPWYTSDLSTMAMNPYEVVQAAGDENFKEGDDENPAIKEDSDLGKYIVACTLRDAQYGVKDAAVQSWIESPTDSGMANALINGAVGLIPVVGDIANIAQGASEAANIKWNTGQACIQDESVNPDWSKNKYYQRYIEDQTLMEASGIIDKSQVTAFVENYYKENPIDNSLEGVIARYSGMTKEEASNTIALAEYITLLGEYDPTTLYPTPVEENVVEISIEQPMFNEEYIEVASVKYVVYADLRGRTQYV